MSWCSQTDIKPSSACPGRREKEDDNTSKEMRSEFIECKRWLNPLMKMKRAPYDQGAEVDDKPLVLFVRKEPGVVYFRRINR